MKGDVRARRGGQRSAEKKSRGAHVPLARSNGASMGRARVLEEPTSEH